jgi:hypothetical protein
MKNNVLRFVLVAALIAAPAAYAIVVAAGRLNYVSFSKSSADAGVVREGQPARVVFVIANTGVAEATIESVQHSCGLSTSFVRQETIAPGEQRELTVNLDTKGRQGPISGTIDVSVRDPLARRVSLTATATVDPEFSLEPLLIDFGDVMRGLSAQREIAVHLARTAHRIVGVNVTNQVFVAKISPEVAADGTVTVIVSTLEAAGQRRQFGTVRILTSSQEMPELSVPLKASFQ